MKNSKNYFSLLALLVVVIALALLAISLPKRIITQQKAAGFGTVNLVLETTKNTLEIGESIPVIIKINNPETRMVSFAEVKLLFNNSLLELVSFTHDPVFDKGQSISPNDNDANDQDVDLGNSSGQAIIPVYDTRQSLPSTDSIVIGTLIVKGKANGTSPLSIAKEESSVVGQNPDASSNVLTLDIGTVTDLSFAVGLSGGDCTACPAGKPTKLQGNANCDGKVDRVDLNSWVEQIINNGQINSQSCADFDGNGIVDRADLNNWVTGMLNPEIPHN
jgi:hypothetical protein